MPATYQGEKTWSQPRTARKLHLCASCESYVRAGERYLLHTLAPGSELGYDTWQHMAECADCATRYGRPIDAEED